MPIINHAKKLMAQQKYFDARQEYRLVFKDPNSSRTKKLKAEKKYYNAEFAFILIMEVDTIDKAILLGTKL